MAVTYLTNLSPGVPTLTGAAGSLITLLDYLLVTTLGWTKAFTGTNIASYRAPTGNRHYLNVDDTTTLNSRLRGFEVATAAGVAPAAGTGPFPTDAMNSGGFYFLKGDDTTTARKWWFLSNGPLFYLTSYCAGSQLYTTTLTFGEFPSAKAADAYNTILGAGWSANDYIYPMYVYNINTAGSGVAIARSYTQLGGAVGGVRIIPYYYGSQSQIGSSGAAYPSPLEGALLLSKVQVSEPGAYLMRGFLPGIWAPLHVRPLLDGDTFTGTGDFAGRSFLVRNSGSSGQVIIELSDTWDS